MRGPIIGLVLSSCAAVLQAQAWVAPKETLSVAVSYEYGFVSRHYYSDGSEFDGGQITSHAATLQMTYSVSDKLAVSTAVPVVMARYNGLQPHALPIDNGDYHGSLQDYRFEARYQLTNGSVAFTPLIGLTLPTHRYPYFAHSAIGRDLRQTTLGFDTGVTDLFAHFRSCGCPTATYLESRLSYSFVEPVLGIRHDHANLDIDLGYFVTDKLGLRALGAYNRTFGGINHDRVNCTWCTPTSPLLFHHDQLLAERHVNLGVGANYAVNDRFDCFTSVFHTVAGRNGHKMDIAAIVGVAWSFAPRNAARH